MNQPSHTASGTSPWPLWLFIAGCLGFNAAIPPLVDAAGINGSRQGVLALICFAGIIGGECLLAVVLAALSRRTWLGGFLLGLLLASLGLSSLSLGFWLVNEFDEEMPAIAGVLPAYLLVAAAPLYACRHLFGWRLVRPPAASRHRQRLGLEGMFSTIAMVATVIALLRAPQVIWESDPSEYWLGVLAGCLVIFFIFLATSPLIVRCGLGASDLLGAAGNLLVLAAAFAGLIFGISQCFFPWNASADRRLDTLPYILGFVGAAGGVCYLSVVAIRRSGFQFVREPAAAASSDEARCEQQSQRRATRWRLAAAIGVTMSVSIGLVNLQAWREAKDLRNTKLTQLAKESGGTIEIHDRRVYRLALGELADDRMLAAFRECRELKYLHFSKSPISDVGLGELRHFPHLESLHLVDTYVTDQGLVHLKHLPRLENLMLQGRDITGAGVAHLANDASLNFLSLPNTSFGDGQCELFRSFQQLVTLDASHTRLTDSGLQRIAALPALEYLKLDGTRVTAQGLSQLSELLLLSLDETPIGDDGLGALDRLWALQNLSLRKTGITNAGVAKLRQLGSLTRLDLSDNTIDDEGIRELQHLSVLEELKLAGTGVTGAGFAGWPAANSIARLHLDRTAVDDKGVRGLANLSPLQVLSLAGTKVTDACLVDLSRLATDSLDLSDTEVTVKGLLASKLRSVGGLILSAEQLQGVDQVRLEKQLGTDVIARRTDDP